MTPHFSRSCWANRMRSAFEAAATEDTECLTWLTERFESDAIAEVAGWDESVFPFGTPKIPAIYVPENYEPGYAYPLIVWLSDPCHSESDLLELMPQVSTQNFLGIALRSNGFLAGLTQSFSAALDASIEDVAGRLYDRVCEVRNRYHIHSERIYVAGCRLSAGLALELLLRHPDWFGGMLSFGPIAIPSHGSLNRYPELRGKRVFLAADSEDGGRSVASATSTGRLLHSAGMDVATCTYSACQEVTGEMLTHANHWLMGGVCQSYAV